MTLTPRDPATILLAGNPVIVEDYDAGEAITPGHGVELYDVGGVLKVRKIASATEYAALCVALDRPLFGKGIDDAYAIGDRVRMAYLSPGCVFLGQIASGQNIADGALLQPAGDGTYKAATATTADANLGRLQSLDNPGAVTALTRLRLQVIG